MIEVLIDEVFPKGKSLTLAQLEELMAAEKARLIGLMRIGKLEGSWGLEQEQLLSTQAFLLRAVDCMISSDPLPKTPCPAFINVRMDYKGIVEVAARLYKEGKITEIWLDGTEGQKANDPYPEGEPNQCFQGYTFWSGALIAAGIPEDLIKPTGPAYNTPDEHKQLMQIGKENGWSKVIVLGNAYQLPRIHLGTITHMKNAGFWLRVHYVVPRIEDWEEDTLGAQGYSEGPRFNQLFAEHRRLAEYGCKHIRDLAPLVEAWNYFVYGRKSIVDGELTTALS